MTHDTLISPDLLAIMQCPLCTGDLAEQKEPPALLCQKCGHAYPVVDGIPNMVVGDDD